MMVTASLGLFLDLPRCNHWTGSLQDVRATMLSSGGTWLVPPPARKQLQWPSHIVSFTQGFQNKQRWRTCGHRGNGLVGGSTRRSFREQGVGETSVLPGRAGPGGCVPAVMAQATSTWCEEKLSVYKRQWDPRCGRLVGRKD